MARKIKIRGQIGGFIGKFEDDDFDARSKVYGSCEYKQAGSEDPEMEGLHPIVLNYNEEITQSDVAFKTKNQFSIHAYKVNRVKYPERKSKVFYLFYIKEVDRSTGSARTGVERVSRRIVGNTNPPKINSKLMIPLITIVDTPDSYEYLKGMKVQVVIETYFDGKNWQRRNQVFKKGDTYEFDLFKRRAFIAAVNLGSKSVHSIDEF